MRGRLCNSLLRSSKILSERLAERELEKERIAADKDKIAQVKKDREVELAKIAQVEKDREVELAKIAADR